MVGKGSSAVDDNNERDVHVGQVNDLKFVVEDDDGNRSVVALAPGEVTVGRLAENTVVLTDKNVSRRHVRLQLDERGHGQVEDLGSYNGVSVNGSRIDGKVAVRPGDVLRIGDVSLTLDDGARAPVALGDETTEANPVPKGIGGDESTQPEGLVGARPLADEQTLPDGSPRPMAGERTEPGAHDAGPLAAGAAASKSQTTGSAAAATSATPTAPYAKLLSLGPPRLGVAFELTRSDTVVGRTPDNHVVLDHPSISRQHAVVRFAAGAFRLVDAGSVNGLYVNGKSVRDAALQYGDVVELGQVRLRLVAPTDAPQLTAEERAQAVAATTPGRRAPSAAGAAFAVGLVAVAAVGGALLVRRHAAPPTGQQPRLAAGLAEDPTEHAGAGVGKGIDDEAHSLLAQAQQALEARQYARAGALANAVLAINPKDPNGVLKPAAQAVVDRAGAEAKGQQALDLANKAVASRNWADAFNALQDVPKDSSQAGKATELLAQVRPALVKDRLAEAKESAEGHDWDQVEVLLQEVASLDPAAPGLDERRAALAEARRAGGKAEATEHGEHAGTTPPLSALPAGKSATKKTEGGAHLPAKLPAGGERRNLSSGEDAKLIYAEGTRALAQGQVQRAIDHFNRCLVADKSYALCYRALGIAYAKGGSGAKAARFYRLYLKVDPAARDAGQVRALLQSYANQADGAAAGGSGG